MSNLINNDCCSAPTGKPSNTATCPACRQKGQTVDTQTVKALLAISLEAVNESSPYRFCRTPDCEIVYFDEESQCFTETDLREQVHQKHPNDGGVRVCYCYQHTPNSIRVELIKGEIDVVTDITAGTKAGTCACDIRNPQGNCCLGNVRKVVKQLTAELNSI